MHQRGWKGKAVTFTTNTQKDIFRQFSWQICVHRGRGDRNIWLKRYRPWAGESLANQFPGHALKKAIGEPHRRRLSKEFWGVWVCYKTVECGVFSPKTKYLAIVADEMSSRENVLVSMAVVWWPLDSDFEWRSSVMNKHGSILWLFQSNYICYHCRNDPPWPLHQHRAILYTYGNVHLSIIDEIGWKWYSWYRPEADIPIYGWVWTKLIMLLHKTQKTMLLLYSSDPLQYFQWKSVQQS